MGTSVDSISESESRKQNGQRDLPEKTNIFIHYRFNYNRGVMEVCGRPHVLLHVYVSLTPEISAKTPLDSFSTCGK